MVEIKVRPIFHLSLPGAPKPCLGLVALTDRGGEIVGGWRVPAGVLSY